MVKFIADTGATFDIEGLGGPIDEISGMSNAELKAVARRRVALNGIARALRGNEAVIAGIPLDVVSVFRWAPDTCGCVVDVCMDKRNAQAKPMLVRVVGRCEAHTNLDSDVNVFSTIVSENTLKNVAVADLSNELGESADEVVWSFDAKRTLRVTHRSIDKLNQAQKGTLAKKLSVVIG